MIIHLVYPHKNKISAPNVIGHKLSNYLTRDFEVALYNYDSIEKIVPNYGDVLIGHPHPLPYTVFRRSLNSERWSRKIIMQPFNFDVRQNAYIDEIIDQCDLFLAITGNYWFDNIGESVFKRWAPKVKQLNLAVDQLNFPKIVNKFNPKGSRRFIYIGNDHPGKNIQFLSQIARKSNIEITWAGKGAKKEGLNNIGFLDFSQSNSQKIISSHDFLITVGEFDANPTTILEALSWGLIPVCTKQSGYYNIPGIMNLELNNIDSAINTINYLQKLDDTNLFFIQSLGRILLNNKFDWERFGDDVKRAILSNETPQLSNFPSVPDAPHIHSNINMLRNIFLKNIYYIYSSLIKNIKK